MSKHQVKCIRGAVSKKMTNRCSTPPITTYCARTWPFLQISLFLSSFLQEQNKNNNTQVGKKWEKNDREKKTKIELLSRKKT
jgi:hypothetical protein